jgi:hypothetical protein
LHHGRRLFLRATLFGGLLLRGGAAAADNATADELAPLAAWLDTLIPADETPSASALGIDRVLLAWARDQAKPLALLRDGCRWLDAVSRHNAGVVFASLPPAAREAVARFAAEAEAASLPRVFFERTWELARQFYYADPRVWPSLGYAGPPQPNGFPDAAQPPHPAPR